MSLWYLFDFSTREVGSISVTLGYLLSEVINKKLKKEKVLFNFFNRSEI